MSSVDGVPDEDHGETADEIELRLEHIADLNANGNADVIGAQEDARAAGDPDWWDIKSVTSLEPRDNHPSG
jgi:hypothetical protein